MSGILTMIEPGAAEAALTVSHSLGLETDRDKIDWVNGDAALLSIAISLKRIADAIGTGMFHGFQNQK